MGGFSTIPVHNGETWKVPREEKKVQLAVGITSSLSRLTGPKRRGMGFGSLMSSNLPRTQVHKAFKWQNVNAMENASPYETQKHEDVTSFCHNNLATNVT